MHRASARRRHQPRLAFSFPPSVSLLPIGEEHNGEVAIGGRMRSRGRTREVLQSEDTRLVLTATRCDSVSARVCHDSVSVRGRFPFLICGLCLVAFHFLLTCDALLLPTLMDPPHLSPISLIRTAWFPVSLRLQPPVVKS